MSSNDPTPDEWTDLATPEMLTERVTLDTYFAERIEWVQRGHISQVAIDRDRQNLEGRAQPGDEWWNWVLGTQPLMQMGGLALVRRGEVVWAREDWIS